jgi:hypothetical protein
VQEARGDGRVIVRHGLPAWRSVFSGFENKARGEQQPSSSFYRWLGFPGGAINVKALAATTGQMTAPIAAATPKAERNADPDDAITGPIRAVATNPPVRATALFSPDAAPVWWLSTDISTAVVSGVTAPAIPKAITAVAGNTPSQ